jgi:hypothetical protein
MRLSLLLLVSLVLVPTAAFAQTKPAPKFGILDNSFLVEEAFNQEAGIFQNIFVVTRSRDGVWLGAFTQEWPVISSRHQASFTLPFSVENGTGASGDVALNYRFQVWEERARRPAFAPRISLLMPTSADRTWDDGIAWQFNLPFSKQVGAVYLHGNAGITFEKGGGSPFVAGSAIVAVAPMFNVMFETLVLTASEAEQRDAVWIFSPGCRTGWNFGAHQLVAGVAVPVTRGAERDVAALGYLSYELPFRK